MIGPNADTRGRAGTVQIFNNKVRVKKVYGMVRQAQVKTIKGSPIRQTNPTENRENSKSAQSKNPKKQ